MRSILASPRSALVAGLVVCAAILAAWLASSSVDRLGLASFLTRWFHIAAGGSWVGLIWFVNFVQIPAMDRAADAERGILVGAIASPVAGAIRHASHLTIVTGLLMLAETGYVLDRWVFNSVVYVSGAKMALMLGASAGALAMWAVVHFVIRPAIREVLASPPLPERERRRARERISTYARLNLVLALPVTFAMVAAAHLY